MTTVKKTTTQKQGPSDAYVIFSRMIIPEMTAALLSAVTTLMREGTQRLTISMSSVGGGVPMAFSLYNNLRALPIHITMHNSGDIASAANVVFVAGDERSASPKSTFMFHAPTMTVAAGAEFDETLLIQHAKDLADGESRTREVLKGRTKMTAAKVDALKRGQNTLDTDAAKQLGLIDRVIDLQIPEGAQIVTV
jgi:ATP-dependent protease ClpP protease subunit